MSTSEERALNDLKVDFIHQQIAGTDKDALEYVQLLSFCARIADDVADEPTSVSADALLAIIEILFIRIPVNKFFCKHRDFLLSQHVVMWNAWEASNILEKGDHTDQIYAHVLRDYFNEIAPLVALLTQGHDKMKEVNSLIRSLFKKELGE